MRRILHTRRIGWALLLAGTIAFRHRFPPRIREHGSAVEGEDGLEDDWCWRTLLWGLYVRGHCRGTGPAAPVSFADKRVAAVIAMSPEGPGQIGFVDNSWGDQHL